MPIIKKSIDWGLVTDTPVTATSAGVVIDDNIICNGSNTVLPGGTAIKLSGTISENAAYNDHDITLISPVLSTDSVLLRMNVFQTNSVGVSERWTAYVGISGVSDITVGDILISYNMGESATVLSFSRPTQTSLRVTLATGTSVDYSITLIKEV